jgi:predicted metal-dependent enzyme (double-stranded beta helix superfamily)
MKVLADTRTQVSQQRLGRMVGAIAAQPESWRDIVRFDAGQRWYHRLDLTDEYEVWLLSWLPGQHTGFHDHGEAVGAFAVALGRLAECTVPAVRPRARSRTFAAGRIRPFGAGHVHDMVNACAAPAVSVHAYSPPLTAMRRYELTAAGLVHTSTEHAELNW